MEEKTKEKLITEWKMLRGKFFNLLNEDKQKFEKACKDHPLYESVIRNFDKSFMEVNQIAEAEIDIYCNNLKTKES